MERTLCYIENHLIKAKLLRVPYRVSVETLQLKQLSTLNHRRRRGTPDPTLQAKPHWLWILLQSCLFALELAVCSIYMLHLLFWKSMLFSKKLVHLLPGLSRFFCFLPALHSSSSMHIYVTVSGPACILLRVSVMSGEVYKKSSSSLAQTVRQK